MMLKDKDADITPEEMVEVQQLVRYNYPNLCWVNDGSSPAMILTFAGHSPLYWGLSWKYNNIGYIFVFEGGGGITCDCKGDRALAIANVVCHEIGHMRGIKQHSTDSYRFMVSGEDGSAWLTCHLLLPR